MMKIRKKLLFVYIILFAITIVHTLSGQSNIGIKTIPEIAPSPSNNLLTKEKVELGKKIFFDKRLSINGEVSCHSCHKIIDEKDSYPSGTDNLTVSVGIYKRKGKRNAPTVWNSGLRSALFWDGRAESLEEQAIEPFINPVEMGLPNYDALIDILESIPGYVEEFENVFKSERSLHKNNIINIKEVGKAIAAFERTLMTPDSPFDLYNKGNINAINEKAKKGWELFKTKGCIGCHGSPTFTRKEFYIKFPNRYLLSQDYNYAFGFTEDKGRFMATGKGKDINSWRVPSLRNVSVTHPYFHNGAINDLREAIRIMGKTQLGITINELEVSYIEEFLKSLKGKIKKIKKPILPN